jgi:hypothetical protein
MKSFENSQRNVREIGNSILILIFLFNIFSFYSTSDIVNRRHSIAHINFRKAIYRSLSLPQVDDDSNNLFIQCIKYLIKFFFICLFILLVGSLIRLMLPLHRHK